MTEPLAHGYADWTRYRAGAARVYVDATFIDIAQTPNFSQLMKAFVGDVPRLSLFIRTSSGQYNVQVQYFSDDPDTGGDLLHQWAMAITVFTPWGHSIAVSGPWVRILASADSATNEISVRATETTQHGFTQMGGDASGHVVFSFTRTVIASSSFSRTSTALWPGMAHFSFSMDPWVPFRWQIVAIPDVGFSQFEIFDIVNSCEQSMWGVIMLPPTRVLLSGFNNGSVDTDILVTVCGQLAAPGI